MSKNESLSRRSFLVGGTAAAGALALTAQSRARAQGANSRLRMAFIGCGVIANEHLSKLMQMRESDNVEIVAVCDVFERRANEFQRKIGREQARPTAHTDYRDVLDRRDIDYVLVATPEHSHAHITLDALDASKHVYVEKPLTHTIAEGQAVLDKVAGTDLKLQVGVQGMADDSYASANRAIREGLLGSVVQAQIDYVRNYSADQGPWRRGGNPDAPQPDGLDWAEWLRPATQREWDPRRYYEWRCYREYSGGIATDLFVHRMTRILKACSLGFPERVVGMGGIYTWPDGRDLPDSFEMLCEYPAVDGITNGMTVHVLGTMANEHGTPHCIRGTEASLYFTRTGWEVKDQDNNVIASHSKTGAEDVYPHHVNHHAAIRDGAELYCPPELGLYGVAACSMANQSWFDKCAMKWNPERGEAVKA